MNNKIFTHFPCVLHHQFLHSNLILNEVCISLLWGNHKTPIEKMSFPLSVKATYDYGRKATADHLTCTLIPTYPIHRLNLDVFCSSSIDQTCPPYGLTYELKKGNGATVMGVI